jgi:hypothetical protein
MKKYKVTTSCLSEYFSVDMDDILSQSYDGADFMSDNNKAGFTENTFNFLLHDHPDWFEEIQEKEFTREDMIDLLCYFETHYNMNNPTYDILLDNWLKQRK